MNKGSELLYLLSAEGAHTLSAPEGQLTEILRLAKDYARTDHSIAVLTDIATKRSYIYNGGFGACIGITESEMETDTLFEEQIFSCIPPDELTHRHVLELRHILFQQQQPVEERSRYNTISLVHFTTRSGETVPVLHRTFIAGSSANGAIRLTLCLYSPFVECPIQGCVIDNRLGRAVPHHVIAPLEKVLLSKRETEILHLLSKGMGSKQIADQLSISVHTVYRHRQNIISALQVANTAEAVSTALAMGLI